MALFGSLPIKHGPPDLLRKGIIAGQGTFADVFLKAAEKMLSIRGEAVPGLFQGCEAPLSPIIGGLLQIRIKYIPPGGFR